MDNVSDKFSDSLIFIIYERIVSRAYVIRNNETDPFDYAKKIKKYTCGVYRYKYCISIYYSYNIIVKAWEYIRHCS